MWDIIVLIISQIAFGWGRTKNVQYIAQKHVVYALLTSTLTKASWLLTTFLGLKGLYESDWVLTVIWLLAGILGDYLAMVNYNSVKHYYRTRTE